MKSIEKLFQHCSLFGRGAIPPGRRTFSALSGVGPRGGPAGWRAQLRHPNTQLKLVLGWPVLFQISICYRWFLNVGSISLPTGCLRGNKPSGSRRRSQRASFETGSRGTQWIGQTGAQLRQTTVSTYPLHALHFYYCQPTKVFVHFWLGDSIRLLDTESQGGAPPCSRLDPQS